MAKSYTVDTLIESLKRRTAIPISQQTFTNDDLQEYLNDEMESTVTPILMDFREEYFVDYDDFPIDGSVNAVFPIPKRAVGERLRDIVIVSTANSGQESIVSLPHLNLELISSYSGGGSTTGSVGTGGAYGSSQGFYVQANDIHLYPARGWGEKAVLRMYYFSRPGRLVQEIGAGKITAINVNTNTVTVNNALPEWVDSFEVSHLRGEQPFNYLAQDVPIVTISGYNITFADVSELSIGDYITNVDESVFPQIPIEGHNLLLQAAKVVLLEAIDDEKNLELAIVKYDNMATNFTKTVTPRIDGAPKKVIAKNGVFNYTNDYWI